MMRKTARIALAFKFVAVASLVYAAFNYKRMFETVHEAQLPPHKIINRAEKFRSFSPGQVNSTAPGTCTPRKKFVFIKTHKTGSCTTINIFQRYAIYNSLRVLMPVGQGPLSWPFPPREQDYVHQPDEQYDAQMHHFVYNKTWLLSKFPPDTPYISIIRQPYSHLKSEFNYFRFPHLLDIHSENPLKTFLTNPWMYRNKSEIFFPHVNVSWDGTRNPLTFDLGWPAEKADNEEDARSYINQIETEFTLVMILEHLAESLVLLRRLLCWNIKDVVLYARKENERAYSFKKYVATPEEMQNHRRWAAVDYMLYDTFNKSLWRKIHSQGPDFYSEVEYFKRICGVISDYCNKTMEESKRMDRAKKNLTEVKMVVKASQWSPEFEVDRTYCSYITSVKVYAMDVRMRGRPYTKDEMSRKMMDQNANIPLMRRGLPSFFTRYEARLAGIDV